MNCIVMCDKKYNNQKHRNEDNNNYYNNYYNKLKKWNKQSDTYDEKWHYDYDLNGYWVKYSWNKYHTNDTWHWVNEEQTYDDQNYTYGDIIDRADTTGKNNPDFLNWVWDNDYHGWWIERWWEKTNRTDYTWVDDNICIY